MLALWKGLLEVFLITNTLCTHIMWRILHFVYSASSSINKFTSAEAGQALLIKTSNLFTAGEEATIA